MRAAASGRHRMRAAGGKMSDSRRNRIVRKQRRMFLVYVVFRLGVVFILVMAAFRIGQFVGGEQMKKEIYGQQLGASPGSSGTIVTVLSTGEGKGGNREGGSGEGSRGTDGSGKGEGSYEGGSVDSNHAGNSGTGSSYREGVPTSGSSGESNTVSRGSNEEGKDPGDLSWIWEEAPLLLLVNKDHKLPEDYEVELRTLRDGVHQAAEIAYDPLNKMLSAGRKEGLRFEVCSSYRSVERQQELLDEDINALMRRGYSYQEAYDEVTMETMPPGYSEHSTGLAFDIVALDYQVLDKKQAETAENKWLREHCAEYGFILRYPEGREDVTGITYESWHFRYVGLDAAAYIMENDLTLEEYIEYIAETERAR